MKIFILVFVFSILAGWGLASLEGKAEMQTFNKQNSCIVLMQKAIPDPNDTEARSNFLKDCNFAK